MEKYNEDKIKKWKAVQLTKFHDNQFSVIIYNMNMVSFLHYSNRKCEFRPSLWENDSTEFVLLLQRSSFK